MNKFTPSGGGEGKMYSPDRMGSGRIAEQAKIDRGNTIAMWDGFCTSIEIMKDRTEKILQKKYSTVQDREGWIAVYTGLRKKINQLFGYLSEERYKKNLKDPEALEMRFKQYQDEVEANFDTVIRAVRSLPPILPGRLQKIESTSLRGGGGKNKHQKGKR